MRSHLLLTRHAMLRGEHVIHQQAFCEMLGEDGEAVFSLLSKWDNQEEEE